MWIRKSRQDRKGTNGEQPTAFGGGMSGEATRGRMKGMRLEGREEIDF